MTRTDEVTTRDRLLAAGIRLFREGRLAILRSLTAGTVADEAGYHRQTFYRHWETQNDYVADLIELAFRPPAPDRRARGLVLGPPPSTFEDRIRHEVRQEFERLDQDPLVSVRIGLLSMGQLREGRPRELAESFHRDAVATLEARWGEVLAASGRRPAPARTLEDVARAVRGCLNGFLTEGALAGDRRRARQLCESSVVLIVTALTESCDPVPIVAHNGRRRAVC